jgi:hypothetical protein
MCHVNVNITILTNTWQISSPTEDLPGAGTLDAQCSVSPRAFEGLRLDLPVLDKIVIASQGIRVLASS